MKRCLYTEGIVVASTAHLQHTGNATGIRLKVFLLYAIRPVIHALSPVHVYKALSASWLCLAGAVEPCDSMGWMYTWLLAA